ncbi:MAG: aminotransferase class IV family protein [Campylobacterota bacterium]|nr:aminotransferase class IV family protein [Campylobacterota bacterium]
MSNSFIETIKAIDGEVYNLEYHQKRYASVLNSLGIDNIQNLSDFLNPPKWGVYRCRLVYDSQSIEVSYHEYKKRDINLLKVIFENDIDYSLKSTNREKLDSLFDLKGECDDILIIKNLFVTDTTIANIAFYKDGTWVTPKSPLLKGTTRARLLDEGKIVEADIKVQELRGFSQVALLNAMIDFDILENCEFLI